MKKIIERVGDMFELKEKNMLIIAGVNHEFDNASNDDIYIYKGEEIMIENPDGSILSTKILDIQISTSIVDKKNIFLAVPITLRDSVKLNAVITELK